MPATPKSRPRCWGSMGGNTRQMQNEERNSLMVPIKPAEADAFVARPDPTRPVVLVFGPDAGLVSERPPGLNKGADAAPNDPSARARLEGEALAAEPSRLVEEAQTVPLFGGKRAVWVKAGSRNIASAGEPLLRVRR